MPTPVQTRRLASMALTLAVAAGLGLAALTDARAQEATAPAASAPDTTAPGAGTPPQIELSMGQEVSAGEPGLASPETAEVGQTYLAGKFEIWEQRCVKTEDGSDPCQLYQLLKDETGGPVAEIALFDLPAGSSQAAAGATVIVPLGTLLTANMQITIDGGKAKIYPFTMCESVGCVSRIGLTAEEVDQFRKGATAVMTIVPAFAPDQRVALNISLKGFTAGFKAVSEANADVPVPAAR